MVHNLDNFFEKLFFNEEVGTFYLCVSLRVSESKIAVSYVKYIVSATVLAIK